ncbi:MAG: hypothetical protein O9249_00120, partial [Burkholderiaceae bacterium]|nr:hypothetical protein [Burkholderiaceae bacterium]
MIQREYHRRIAGEHRNAMPVALEMTSELAIEYERKLLPVRSRLKLPSIEDYLGNAVIRFHVHGDGSRDYSIGPIHFRDWIEGILMGPVNGLENSTLHVPIPSLRALAQLTGGMREAIGRLDDLLRQHPRMDALDIRTLLQMPGTPRDTIRAFARAQDESRAADKTNTESAYSLFTRRRKVEQGFPPDGPFNHEARSWRRPLYDLLQHEPTAGKACMVLEASMHWDATLLKGPEVYSRRGVLDTPLFMPLLQQNPLYLESAPREARLNGWKEALKGLLPDDAVERLPDACIAPFPFPESGRRMAINWRTRFSASDIEVGEEESQQIALLAELNVINELMLHRGYYSVAQRAPLVLTGRLLELLVTSLVRDVTEGDLYRLQNAPPFHSAAAMAPTKTLILEGDETDEELEDEVQSDGQSGIALLVKRINDWRQELGLADFELSPWLIYNALNKTLGQARLFNPPSKAALPVPPAVFVAQTARMAFDCFVSAVGSFEKGPLFGLEPVVSTINVSRSENFRKSPLYLQNVSPFWGQSDRDNFGQATRSITQALGGHPIRKILNHLPAVSKQFSQGTTQSNATNKELEDSAKKWLRRRLG